MLKKFLLTALDHLIPRRDLLLKVHNGACLYIQLITKPDKKFHKKSNNTKA